MKTPGNEVVPPKASPPAKPFTARPNAVAPPSAPRPRKKALIRLSVARPVR
jgi:hypothetical protein